jgi:hypothetical protein
MSWYESLKDRLFGPTTPTSTIDATPVRPVISERGQPPPPPKTIPTFASALWRFGPYVVLGVGLAMTLFAERLHNWAWLGFMLLASAPILFALRRIEDLLKELVELTKTRR